MESKRRTEIKITLGAVKAARRLTGRNFPADPVHFTVAFEILE